MIQGQRLRAGNNAAERALMDMMGGILEKKLEVAAKEEEIQRPAWMAGNPKKFTKEQHMEIKNFDAMLKVWFCHAAFRIMFIVILVRINHYEVNLGI